MMMHTETTTNWMFSDDSCDMMANGAMMETAVNAGCGRHTSNDIGYQDRVLVCPPLLSTRD